MKRSLNIAILGRDFLWSGGTEFIRNLANALLSIREEHSIRLFLLLPIRNKVDTFTDLRKLIWKTVDTIVRQRIFLLPKREAGFEPNFLDYFKHVDGGIELVEYNEETGLTSALQRLQVDIVLPAVGTLGTAFPFPWVGYIFDFQHKYYPSYFSARECMDRDIHFATMLRDAKAIIVNAKSVKDDIDNYFPYHECKVFNLPFLAAPISNWLEDSNLDLLARYNLPPRYFLISNQFWIHKSHSTAFNALSMLLDDECGKDLSIVCTGKMEDYRFPDYIRDLQGEVRTLGINDKVHFLGHIPKIDQIAIMKNSLAVLQPTLFEGGPGGGSVCDAVSLGIPVILSDIQVNKEIENERNLFYFEKGSAIDLAEKMREFLKSNVRQPSKTDLLARGEKRKRLVGEYLLEVINYVREGMLQRPTKEKDKA
jgi:glycosyltransferase involved in cell wall biosynthesis